MLRAAGCEMHIIAAASSQQVGPLSAPAANLRIDGGELFNHGGAPDALEARMGVAAWAGAAIFSACADETARTVNTQVATNQRIEQIMTIPYE